MDAPSSAWLVATVWHAVINARAAMALTILVSLSSFFICFCFECVVSVLRAEFKTLIFIGDSAAMAIIPWSKAVLSNFIVV